MTGLTFFLGCFSVCWAMAVHGENTTGSFLKQANAVFAEDWRRDPGGLLRP